MSYTELIKLQLFIVKKLSIGLKFAWNKLYPTIKNIAVKVV